MIRLLLFILTFCFLLQSTGAASMLKKSAVQTEQCSDDFQKGEEKGKEERKTDQERNGYFTHFFINSLSVYFLDFENIQCCPSGFYSKPFLPPRIPE